LPFVELPRHKRRDAVIQLGWKIARQAEDCPFWTDHLLVDPEDPHRIHRWIDVYFLGADPFTFWNATIVTLELARQDELQDRSFKLAHAQLSAEEIEREFAIETISVPRTRPGQVRSRLWIQQPKQCYPQFDERTFHAECERLEAHLLATDPPTIHESFTLDRGYAYGVGLHAVVDEATLDGAAVERCIDRFREHGERDWTST
jgi:hypothetical protein